MGRRRHTAKTGDKALYKKRDVLDDDRTARNQKGDDPTYDEVDQFHNQRDEDFLKLSKNDGDEEESSEDEIDRTDAVMDLGMGGNESSSSEDDGDDDSSIDEPAQGRSLLEAADSDDDDEQVSLSSDDDNEELPLKTNVLDWGRQKKDYYHGDTADLELGQEEDDAFVEEQAAKEIQAARYEQMKEEDFILSDDEEDGGGSEAKPEQQGGSLGATSRDVMALSRSEKAKLLDRQHPELLPLISHFAKILREWNDQTNVVASALLEGGTGTAESVGATKLGQTYLTNKAMLQASAGLNLSTYLLLKSDQASSDIELDPSWVQSHPVMKHLHRVNALLHKVEETVEDKEPTLSDQMDKLAKASALLVHGEVDLENEEEGDLDEMEQRTSGDDDDAERNHDKDEIEVETGPPSHGANKRPDASSEDSSGSDDSDEEESTNELARSRLVANEARFGLRPNEVAPATQSLKQRRKAPVSDYGDGDDANAEEAGKLLSATLNSIEQRSATRKRKSAPAADTVDMENEDDRLRLGLAMMEQDLGPASDEDVHLDKGEGKEEGAFDPEQDEDDFYSKMSKKSKRKKDFKKNLYAVQPKYPRMEEEIEGERAISRTILKNRGLVPHKNKLNRNPRVKKREQYRKALIRRRGAVQEVRKDEGHKYGGEATGIKTNISRSRRFAG